MCKNRVREKEKVGGGCLCVCGFVFFFFFFSFSISVFVCVSVCFSGCWWWVFRMWFVFFVWGNLCHRGVPADENGDQRLKKYSLASRFTQTSLMNVPQPHLWQALTSLPLLVPAALRHSPQPMSIISCVPINDVLSLPLPPHGWSEDDGLWSCKRCSGRTKLDINELAPVLLINDAVGDDKPR